MLDVSAGQRRAATPNVVGMDRQDAQLALEKVGLEVGAVQERESPVTRGQVLSISPAAGTQLILPSAISLVVSTGPATIEVPYLVGRPFGEARAQLEQLGLDGDDSQDRFHLPRPGGDRDRSDPVDGVAVGAGTASGSRCRLGCMPLTVRIAPSLLSADWARLPRRGRRAGKPACATGSTST